MFICEYSGKLSEKGVSPVKVIIETRPKTFEVKDKKGRVRKLVHSWEIVKELKVLPELAKKVMEEYNTESICRAQQETEVFEVEDNFRDQR